MLLIKNILCLYTGSERLKNRDLLIEEGRIKAVGQGITSPSPDAAVIDASGMVATPGFVNTHHHFYQILTRNLPAVQNSVLFHWLTYLYDIWKHLTPAAVTASSLAAMAELLKTGCTCTTDHHYLYPREFSGDIMDLQFAAADRLGIRFAPTRGSMSLSRKDGGLPPDEVVQDSETILRDSARVIEAYHDPAELSMHRIALAPCSPFSVTPELMRETAALAREKGVTLHTHLAETGDEDDYCRRSLGIRPLELMEEVGFLGPDVSFAHGIHFNDDELALLKETGTSICHCPSSNMRLGSGIARVTEMLAMGINVALAVDGSASNDASDFLGEMRQALLLQRVKNGADAVTAEDIFTMGCRNGAQVLGYHNLGRLEPGWGADLALFDLNRLDYAGALSDPLAALLFCGTRHETAYTIVNGKVVVRRGELVGINEEELTSAVNEEAASLWQRAGIKTY